MGCAVDRRRVGEKGAIRIFSFSRELERNALKGHDSRVNKRAESNAERMPNAR